MQSTLKSRKSGEPMRSQEETECDEQFSEVVIHYQKQVEGIVAELLCMEEQLYKLDTSLDLELQSASFDQVLAEYGKHEEFIRKFCEFSQVIMKCREEGQEMRDSESPALEEHERDQVTIQIDALMVCYEKLKILATDRLHRLQSILEHRQQLNVERFEQWLSNIESKVCNANNIGPDYVSLLRQIDDMKKLSHELGLKQEFLNFMSNVIIFDEIDSESLQMQSKSYDSLDTRLENMNMRWEKVCKYVQYRNDKLKRAESLWTVVNTEWPPLMNWIKKMKRSLSEISAALKNLAGNTQTDRIFVQKLIPRYEKIKSEIKGKRSSYSSLENRVRSDIDKFDDPCSMLVIELEKKLEELQGSWDELKNQKRKIDYTLENLKIPTLNGTHGNTISAPEESNISSEDEIKCENPRSVFLEQFLNNEPQIRKDNAGNSMQNSSHSSINEERESNITMSNSLSEPRAFDHSFSPDSKSHLYQAKDKSSSLNDSQDDISSNSMTTPHKLYALLARVKLEPNEAIDHNDSIRASQDLVGIHADENDNQDHHNCRVEEWKHSLESFSTWLKKVESTFGFSDALETSTNEESETWSRLDLDRQYLFLNEIQNSIDSKYGEDFESLILQGQQIIEDLIPEISDNNYEADLKRILNDLETRYYSVKRCLVEKRDQILRQDRWLELINSMKASCTYIIGRTGEVPPESEIGQDLITLAQQQDKLLHFKEDMRSNSTIETAKREAKLFLKLCDIMHGNPPISQTSSPIKDQLQFNHDADLWHSLLELRDDIGNQLDRLSLHLSEFFQLVNDRLAHLREVYEDMHSLKQEVQELAPKLQVAEILKSNWPPIEGLSVEQLSEQLEDLKLFRERLDDSEAALKVLNSILDRMHDADVPLSRQNRSQVDELNSTWQCIIDAVSERQKLIEQAFDNQSSLAQKFLEETLADEPDWKRKVAVSKVPYFLNLRTKKTTWDHPKFSKILDDLSSTKRIVFAAYRTAFKLRVIQRGLSLDMLMLEHLNEILDHPDNNKERIRSQTNPRRDHYKTLFGVEQILPILKAIFEKVKEEKQSLDLPLSVDLTLNWLLNLYDPTHSGYISALSLRLGLTILCCATLEEKHSSIYQYMLSDLQVDYFSLMDLFRALNRIPNYLGEGAAFSDDELYLENTMLTCFTVVNAYVHLSLEDYLKWVETEPNIMIWLAVLHRILVSEDVVHRIRCKLCSVKPITGLRYKCLKCLNYNICQNCFLTGRHINEHHQFHEMQEYCSETSSGGSVKDLARVLRNKITPKPHS